MVLVPRRIHGFTLIELMLTLTVTVVLLLIAVPSFETFRQRAAVRAAADQTLALWEQARFESAKRNTWVKFVRQTSGTAYCIGAATNTTDNPGTGVTCDCFEAVTTETDYCNVARFPASVIDQGDWRGVTISTGSVAPPALAAVVIEPKRTFLTPSSAAGAITLNGPPGQNAYTLYMRVDTFGRGILCEPSTATSKLSDYGLRRCTP